MKKLSILMFVFILIAVLGCNKDEDPISLDDFNDAIDAAGEIPIVENRHDITVDAYCLDGTINEESHSVAQNFVKITHLGLNDAVLWPGNIIKGDRITNYIYEPVSLERAPITISINLEGSTGGGDLSTIIDDPALSTVRQGIHDIIESSVGVGVDIPAKVEIEKTQVYSESHMDLAIGADLSYYGSSLSSKFNWGITTQKTRIVARYKQIYYTIHVDQPTSPADFFDPSITLEEVNTAMPPGSQPVYVSGVSYGAMALMFIESDFSEELVNLAIDASYSGFGLDVAVNSEYKARDIFEESSASVVVYGGSTDGISTFSKITLDAFFEYISASSKFDVSSNIGAVPLSYNFLHLSNSTLAQVSLTSDYTIITPCHPLKYKVSLEKFYCAFQHDQTGDYGEFNKLWVDVRAFDYSSETNEEIPNPSLSAYPFDDYPDQPQEGYICYYSHPEDGIKLKEGLEITTIQGDPLWMPQGNLWNPEYEFHSSPEYDTDRAGLMFTAFINEYDGGGTADEQGEADFKLFLPDFNNNEGIHIFSVVDTDGDGFRIDVHVKIEAIIE